MKVLLFGATGFIGRHVAAHLLCEGHGVVAAVRDVESATRRFPGIEAVRVDLNRMTMPADWTPLLFQIDAVVNCAGILQSGAGQLAHAIHALAPIALFQACEDAGLQRIVHVSAVSADSDAGTEYAATKKAADDDLRSRNLQWVLLRPSLVYASGSYGGTSAIRGALPLGYDTKVGERGGSLSGGQRQRIAIARALVTDPRILIFDEATSALDYESGRVVQDNLRDICRGRTVFIIAHRLSAVRHADRIVAIENSRLVEQGSHEELVRHGGRYAKLHALQGGVV